MKPAAGAAVILWTDGPHGALENMRRDAALLAAAAGGRLPAPVLRLFTFHPAGITLGRSQDPGRELDLSALERDGIEWAVRPTGGRAIFHDEEWTFSYCAAAPPGAAPPDPREAYALTCRRLAAALGTLGVPAELSPGSPRGVGPPRSSGGPAAPCFASRARDELTLEGRKLAGLAQRSVRGALLQQGSLLLGRSHLRLADYVRLDAAGREGVRAGLAAAAADAGAYLGPARGLDRLAGALAAQLPGARRLEGEAGARALGL